MVSFVGIKTMAGYCFARYCSLKQVYHMFMAHTHTCRIEILAFLDTLG